MTKVEAELLDLFSAAGEDAAEHNIVVPAPAPAPAPVPDLRDLTPPPIRRRTLHSPEHPPFRSGVVQEYGQLAATLRQPTPPASISKAHKTVVSKSVASAKKHFYHTMENDGSRTGSSYAKKGKDKKRRVSWAAFDITGMDPPATPSQAALAAQQTLKLATRVNRG